MTSYHHTSLLTKRATMMSASLTGTATDRNVITTIVFIAFVGTTDTCYKRLLL